MTRKTTIEIICSLLILLFTYTAISKLAEVNTLKNVLKSYPLVGVAAPIIAWGLPFIEILVAALLFFPATRIIGLYGALVLMGVFTLYVGYMLIFTSGHFCTCGGILEKLTWPEHLIFNILFTLMTIAGILKLKNGKIRENDLKDIRIITS